MQTAKNTITKITPAIKREIVKIIDERIREAHVTKEDFSELKAIVKDLGIKTAELAEAQKRSEERITKVEIALNELAQAQKRTEERVEELAQAQKRTEEALAILTKEHGITRKMLGGLSNTVGYRLEDEAFKALPLLLKEKYGIDVKGRLKRTFVKDKKGRDIEVNIFGEATKEDKSITIIGESKSQLSKNDIDSFINRKLKLFKGVFDEVFPIIVTYMISEPDAEVYAKDKGIALFYSYEF